MKSSTALIAGLVVYFLVKKAGNGGLSGLGDYPYPGNQPGYYSSAAYTQWYNNQYVPYYYRTYGQYPPSYISYQQQGQANLYYQDSSGAQYIDFDRPTPVQNRPQQQYSYYPQQSYYQQYQYPQYGYPYQPYSRPAYQYAPGAVDPNYPM